MDVHKGAGACSCFQTQCPGIFVILEMKKYEKNLKIVQFYRKHLQKNSKIEDIFINFRTVDFFHHQIYAHGVNFKWLKF